MNVNPNQALWERGDFTAVAAFIRKSGEDFVDTLNIDPSMKVLDLGSGDGTTALPIARMGADVTGIDIARNLVEAGNRRSDAAGLTDRLRFQHGDACALEGVSDHSFDFTLSVFGAMFAPKPFDVAREMVRVTRPGGRIVMGNWIPNDPTFVSQLLKLSTSFLPPPPEGFISPMLWGVEPHVLERFEQAGAPRANVHFERATFYFVSDQSTDHVANVFRRLYGPTMNAFDAAEKTGRGEELLTALTGLAAAQNMDLEGGTRIPATCMKITVRL